MIRALALACVFALPLQAQDLRGLLPGMPTSDLARLGEPFDLQSDGGLTAARYPLPFERQLSVLHGGGQIISIGIGDPGSRMRPPEADVLTVGVSTLAEALNVAGSEGYTFDTESALTMVGDIPVGWTLYYDVPDAPELVLSLSFHRIGVSVTEAGDAAQTAALPTDATLVSFTLQHADFIAAHPDVFGTTRIDRPGAAPFATPLPDALPLG